MPHFSRSQNSSHFEKSFHFLTLATNLYYFLKWVKQNTSSGLPVVASAFRVCWDRWSALFPSFLSTPSTIPVSCPPGPLQGAGVGREEGAGASGPSVSPKIAHAQGTHQVPRRYSLPPPLVLLRPVSPTGLFGPWPTPASAASPVS